MNKTFDCVEMKRQGAARVREKLKGLTLEEKLAYWHRRTEELRKRQQELRQKEQANS